MSRVGVGDLEIEKAVDVLVVHLARLEQQRDKEVHARIAQLEAVAAGLVVRVVAQPGEYLWIETQGVACSGCREIEIAGAQRI